MKDTLQAVQYPLSRKASQTKQNEDAPIRLLVRQLVRCGQSGGERSAVITGTQRVPHGFVEPR